MLDLQPVDLAIVNAIFTSQLSAGTEVYAFGSRTKNSARKFSDLDILIKPVQPLSYLHLSSIEEDFSESDLPFRTDIVDWHRIDDDFKALITPQLVRIL